MGEGRGIYSVAMFQKEALLESRAFLFVQPSGKQYPVRHRGREQHVRPVSVPAGSNSPVDCWKVRGSLWCLISRKGGWGLPTDGAQKAALHSVQGCFACCIPGRYDPVCHRGREQLGHAACSGGQKRSSGPFLERGSGA